MKELSISPSMLAANFANLSEDLQKVKTADYLHVDIMDGNFVPNISFGPSIVSTVSNITELPLDIHLMVSNPEQYLSQFASLNPAFITVHYESCIHLQRILSEIRDKGLKSGLALNPHTPISVIEHILPDIDLLLIMTVNPGFGGQKFIKQMKSKIETAYNYIQNYDIELQVDGGINLDNVNEVVESGAENLVLGSAVFGAANPQDYIEKMRAQILS